MVGGGGKEDTLPFKPAITMKAPSVQRPVMERIEDADLASPIDTLTHIWDDLKSGFKNLQQTIDQKFKKKLDCRNGGKYDESRNNCHCPPLFNGKECENIECLNGGVNMSIGRESVCSCFPAPYVSGQHCQTIECGNGGILNATICHCPIVYSGRYCESWLPSVYAPVAIPAAALLLALLCCFVCRLNLCPRSPRRRERRRDPPLPLLPSSSRSAGVSMSNGVEGAYVIRLDTIPTFNPSMVGGVSVDEDDKRIDPPPPYEDALRAPTSAPSSCQPPRYQRRPPTNSRPP